MKIFENSGVKALFRLWLTALFAFIIDIVNRFRSYLLSNVLTAIFAIIMLICLAIGMFYLIPHIAIFLFNHI